MLRAAALPQSARAGSIAGGRPAAALGGRAGWRIAALALREGRRCRPGSLQPLLAAAHDRGSLRAKAPGLRRGQRGALVQQRGLLQVDLQSLAASSSVDEAACLQSLAASSS